MTIQVIISILILNIHHKGDAGKPAPDWLIWIAYVLSKITFHDLIYENKRLAQRINEFSCFGLSGNKNMNAGVS
jgi:hypothetical protein